MSTLVKSRSLSKSYGEGRWALKEVDLTLHSGEVVGVLGANGAGKSTLLRLLNRLIIPTSGELYVLGQDMNRLRGRKLGHFRRSVAYLSQRPAVVESLSVKTNVALGRLGESGSLRFITRLAQGSLLPGIQEALAFVGLEGLEEAGAGTLSGGERQRLAFARACFQAPQLWLADEPFSSLDSHSTQTLLSLLKAEARQGKTVIVSLHDRNLAYRLCSRWIILNYGRVVYDGLPSQNLEGFLAAGTHPGYPEPSLAG